MEGKSPWEEREKGCGGKRGSLEVWMGSDLVEAESVVEAWSRNCRESAL